MRTTETATRAVAYVRVSTDKQAERGLSIEAQIAKVSAYAALYDVEVVGTEVDAGESAKSLARPALQRALAALQRGEADAILVVKLDRLTRSVRDLGELVDELFSDGRRSLLSVEERIDTRTAAGRLVLNVLASVAQWEREATGERTSAVMRHKADRGEYIGGGVPYGFRLSEDGKRLEPDAREQEAVAEARNLRAAGLTLRATAEKLHLQGHRTRSGARFSATQVRRLVRATHLDAAPEAAAA